MWCFCEVIFNGVVFIGIEGLVCCVFCYEYEELFCFLKLYVNFKGVLDDEGWGDGVFVFYGKCIFVIVKYFNFKNLIELVIMSGGKYG